MSADPNAKKPYRLLAPLFWGGLAVALLGLFYPAPSHLILDLACSPFPFNLEQHQVRLKVGGVAFPTEPIRSYKGQYLSYAGRVPSGRQNVTIEVQGFDPITTQMNLKSGSWQKAQVALNPQFGQLTIIAKDAQNPDQILPQYGAFNGQEFATGSNRLPPIVFLPEGRHNLQVKASGYCPTTLSVDMLAGHTMDKEAVLSKALKVNERARLVLTWGENPTDVDSHLILPADNQLDQRWIYFGQKQASKDTYFAAVLDVDDTTSFGPETITISNQSEGRYRYFLHHYAGTGSLGSAEIQVKLVTSGCHTETFSVPGDCQERYYYLFELLIENGRASIVPKHTCASPQDLAKEIKGLSKIIIKK